MPAAPDQGAAGSGAGLTAVDIIFLVLVVFLLVLACVDLFVGVSNDAVNFLNSAIGSRIAPLAVILGVAGLGVLGGATFSSGMMEVARQGMFHPQMFSFEEIMVIFFAVMITDVLLLNVFNAFGLPTSTTVSIVFELFGAGVCTAAYKLCVSHVPLSHIFEYIKSDRAMTIISAIVASVVVAFLAGMLAQFVCRMLFTFRFRHTTYRYLGGIFTGASLTAIIYFLVMKGARGASFMRQEYLDFIDDHTQAILLTCMVTFTLLAQLLVALGRNVFRIIILCGTFALAFSFAGNDLVNFIGVPLAALDAYLLWSHSGQAADVYAMGGLNESGRTPTYLLLIAGCIMVITLYTSRRALRGIQTSINLSSSQRGTREQFGASATGRIVTRAGLAFVQAVHALLPNSLLHLIARRYRPQVVDRSAPPLPFDYVRASVNLTLAAILISTATSLKLPLSTTYVTFMVAMGTSFADGAWDRESAVYRISGVVAVVAGWFLTAFCAFTACAMICTLILACGHGASLVLMVIAAAAVYRSNFRAGATRGPQRSVIAEGDSTAVILQKVADAAPQYMEQNLGCVRRALDNFCGDNELALRRARTRAAQLLEDVSAERAAYFTLAQHKGKDDLDAKHFFFLVFSNLREVAKSMDHLLEQAVNHIANRHSIFGAELQASLYELLPRLERIHADLQRVARDPSAGQHINTMVKHVRKLNRDLDRRQLKLVEVIGQSRKVSIHSSEMYLTFLQTIRDIANRYIAVAMQERALAQNVSAHLPAVPQEAAPDRESDGGEGQEDEHTAAEPDAAAPAACAAEAAAADAPAVPKPAAPADSLDTR